MVNTAPMVVLAGPAGSARGLWPAILPQQASANAGTPLMWAGVIHLVIGNALIGSSDGHVYRRDLLGGDERRICELHSIDENDRLFVRPSAADTNHWDLMARLETADHRFPRFVPVLMNLNVEAAPDWRSTHSDPPQYDGTWFSFGKVQALGSATNSQWEFWAGFWPVEGLRAARKETGERLRFSYETPFGAWTVRNAVHLPSDKVLFQLGDDQICGFDPVDRRVALLWHGRGPVPVIEKGMSNQSVQPTRASRFAQSETRTSLAAGSRRGALR